jgi:hypothetical protein
MRADDILNDTSLFGWHFGQTEASLPLRDGRTTKKDGGAEYNRLTLRRMFKTAVGNGANEFGFQEEILESGGMDSSIAAFGVGSSSSSTILFSFGRGSLCRGDFLVGVIDEIFFGRHCSGLGKLEAQEV